MAKTWNQFNKELQNRISDAQMRYMMGLLYEQQLHILTQFDEMTNLMITFANTLAKQNVMQQADQAILKQTFEKMKKVGLVSEHAVVESVQTDPNDKKH